MDKRYYGYTDDWQRRFVEHALQPPARMARDLDVHGSFHACVHAFVVAEFRSARAALACEQSMIRTFRTTNSKFGYNVLDGRPGWSAKFWYLHRRGLLKSQQNTCSNPFQLLFENEFGESSVRAVTPGVEPSHACTSTDVGDANNCLLLTKPAADSGCIEIPDTDSDCVEIVVVHSDSDSDGAKRVTLPKNQPCILHID